MRPQVLVAEDEETIALVVSRSLESIGCDVTVARDGMEALVAGLEEDYDLAIVDHLMPQLNGMEVLQRWKRAGRGFPVIVLSAVTGEDDVVRGLDLGAVDYVRKPFSVRELLARVRVHLRKGGEVRHIAGPQAAEG